MLVEQKAEAQQVLDGLLNEGLIPFKLTVGKLVNKGLSNYRLHFYDSRILSVKFSLKEGETFQDIFRASVLDRVKKMSGPLYRKTPL